jgi:hypothetical protein
MKVVTWNVNNRVGTVSQQVQELGQREPEVQLLERWIILVASANSLWAGFFVMGQSGEAISPRSEAPSDFFCWHVHQPPHDMFLQPHLA